MAARRTANAKPKEQEAKPTAEEQRQQAAAPSAEEQEKEQAAAPSAEEEKDPDYVVAEVVEKFRDKDTGSILHTGIFVVVSPERFAELESAGVAREAEM